MAKTAEEIRLEKAASDPNWAKNAQAQVNRIDKEMPALKTPPRVAGGIEPKKPEGYWGKQKEKMEAMSKDERGEYHEKKIGESIGKTAGKVAGATARTLPTDRELAGEIKEGAKKHGEVFREFGEAMSNIHKAPEIIKKAGYGLNFREAEAKKKEK